MKKSVAKLAASVLSAAIVIGSFSFNIFADEDTKTYGSTTYTYNPSTGWYEYYGKRLLTQEILEEKCNGVLPIGDDSYNTYNIETDLKVTGGTKFGASESYKYVYYYLNDNKITYTGDSDYLFEFSNSDNTYVYVYANGNEGTGEVELSGKGGFFYAHDYFGYYQSELYFYGGTLRGNQNLSDSAIKLLCNVRFTMYSGTITDCHAENGGALYIDAVKAQGEVRGADYPYAELYGGTITNCSATSNGGAVYTKGSVRLANVSLTNNYAGGNGGAICADGDVGGISVYYYSQKLNISDNSCGGLGGAAYLGKGRSMGLSGNVNVDGNTSSSGNANNVYFAGEIKGSVISTESTFSGCFNFTFEDYSSAVNKVIAGVYSATSKDYLNIEDENYTLEYADGNGLAALKLVEKSAPITTATVKGYSVVLDGSTVGLRCHIALPENVEASDLTVSAKMNVSYSKDPHEMTLSPDADRDENGYVTYTYPVAPVYMTMVVKFSIVLPGETKAMVADMTVADYLRVVYSKTTDEKTKGLVESLACYGAAAQLHFGYSVADLAYKFVSEDHREKAFNAIGDISEKSALQTTYNFFQAEGSPMGYYGASMIFESSPKLKFYFIAPKNAEDMQKIKIYIDNKEVQPLSIDEYYYGVTMDNINIKNLANGVNVVVEYDGETVINLTYSPMNYIARTYSKTTKDDMKALLSAMYCYYYNITNINSI